MTIGDEYFSQVFVVYWGISPKEMPRTFNLIDSIGDGGWAALLVIRFEVFVALSHC